jgi:hypothetical protein
MFVMLFGPFTVVAGAAITLLAFRMRFVWVCAAAAGMAIASLLINAACGGAGPQPTT